MPESSRPWGGNWLGDAGRYDGQEWSERWRTRYVDSDEWDERGPIQGLFEELSVEPLAVAAMAIEVRTGGALVHTHLYINTTPVQLPIAANTSGLLRYDRVVLRKYWTDGTIRAVVLSGVPGGGGAPVGIHGVRAPVLNQTVGVQFEIPLATISVANGAVFIDTAAIIDERQFVKVYRKRLGLGKVESILATGAIDVFGGDLVGWELDPGDHGDLTVIIPEWWGDQYFEVFPIVWGAQVSGGSAGRTFGIQARAIPPNWPAANTFLWCWWIQLPSSGDIMEIAPTIQAPLYAYQGWMLQLYFTDVPAGIPFYYLGLDLLFLKVGVIR